MERLEQTGRTHVINGVKIKARKRTNNKWFETQDAIGYWEDFSKPKIMYSEIVRSPRFYLDAKGEFFPEATTFILTGEHVQFLVDFLNSDVSAYIFKTFYAGGGLGEDGVRYKKAFLERMPVPKPRRDIKKVDDALIYSMYGFSEEEIRYIVGGREG